MTDPFEGNLEFLNFIVDISDPGTGEIRIERLATWLGLTSKDLVARWHRSGHAQWTDYANDVLKVLDRMHDRTHALSLTFDWYRLLPISTGTDLTGDDLVATGRADEALQVLRNASCPRENSARGRSNKSASPQSQASRNSGSRSR
jgi:hypothetical protein